MGPETKEHFVQRTTRAVIYLADLALLFGRIDRTGPCHPDGTPESDTDHTVMLAWIAPALADLVNKQLRYQYFDVGLVTQFAVVHDAPETLVGDTPTIRITPQQLAVKAGREAVAASELAHRFGRTMPWFAKLVVAYERQEDRNARFVRAVDKLLPKAVHIVDAGIGLRQNKVSRAEFITLVQRQRAMVLENLTGGADEELVLGIYDKLCAQVLAEWDENHAPVVSSFGKPHVFVVGDFGTMLEHSCKDADSCEFSRAYVKFLANNDGPLAIGRYPVALDSEGLLNFIGD